MLELELPVELAVAGEAGCTPHCKPPKATACSHCTSHSAIGGTSLVSLKGLHRMYMV